MVAVLSEAAERLQRDGDAEDRSLFGAYLDWAKVLLPQLEMPVPEPDTEAILEWSDLMDGLTVLEARSGEWPREWLAQGREEGRKEGREQGRAEGRAEGREQGQLALLRRLASRRFGAATAEALVAALPGNGEAGHLEAVADLVLDCETGPELLDRVNGKPGP